MGSGDQGKGFEDGGLLLVPLPTAPWPGARAGLEPLRCGRAFVPREESCVRRKQLLLGPGVQAEAQLPAVGCCAAWPPKCVGREKNDGGLCGSFCAAAAFSTSRCLA